MCRHEPGRQLAADGGDIGQYRLLGAADIADDGTRLERRPQGRQRLGSTQHGHRQHHEIGIADRVRRRLGGLIHHAEINRETPLPLVRVVAVDAADGSGEPERPRQRAADQAQADDGQTGLTAHPARISVSAFSSLSFCAGVPMVMRRKFGIS